MTQPITLITGASGLIGTNLVHKLLSLGRTPRVLVFQDDDESLRDLNVQRFYGDITQPDTLTPAFEGVEIVYHLAAAISIDSKDHQEHIHHINVQGTQHVVNACLLAGVRRLLHFSSIHALSYLPKELPIDESRALALDPNLHLTYDHTKALGERIVLDAIPLGLDAVIFNPVGIFGPLDFRPSPTGELLLQMVQRQFPGLIQSGFYWVDVRDVVDAAIRAETLAPSGERYILSGEYVSLPKIAKWVHELTGARPPLFNSPIWLAKLTAPLVTWFSRQMNKRPLFTSEAVQIVCCHQNIHTDKAHRELDFSPRPIRDSIHDSLLWLQQHGTLKKTPKPIPPKPLP